MSNIGHLITMPVGFYLLFSYPKIDLAIQGFISFQILIGVVLLGKIFGTICIKKRTPLGDQLMFEF